MRASLLTVVAVLSGALWQPAQAAEPDHIVYEMGGVMSMPYRLEGDLVTGEFTETVGSFRSEAPPTVKHWTPPPDRLATLRHLAARAWGTDGIEQAGITHIRHPRKGPPVVTLEICAPAADAMGTVTVERDGRKKSFDFSPNCLSRPGKALVDALLAPSL